MACNSPVYLIQINMRAALCQDSMILYQCDKSQKCRSIMGGRKGDDGEGNHIPPVIRSYARLVVSLPWIHVPSLPFPNRQDDAFPDITLFSSKVRCSFSSSLFDETSSIASEKLKEIILSRFLCHASSPLGHWRKEEHYFWEPRVYHNAGDQNDRWIARPRFNYLKREIESKRKDGAKNKTRLSTQNTETPDAEAKTSDMLAGSFVEICMYCIDVLFFIY